MKMLRSVYTLAAASTIGYAANVTGGTWNLTATTSGDGCSHPVTIVNNSITDHSAKTATITGTTADGIAQTEVINLPGASGTVTSTKYFKTVTSVIPSATIGVDTMNIGWTALAYTPYFSTDFPGAEGIIISVGVGGTINYTTQQTVSNVSNISVIPLWQTLGSPGITTSSISQALLGTTAVRAIIASHTSGVLTVESALYSL